MIVFDSLWKARYVIYSTITFQGLFCFHTLAVKYLRVLMQSPVATQSQIEAMTSRADACRNGSDKLDFIYLT